MVTSRLVVLGAGGGADRDDREPGGHNSVKYGADSNQRIDILQTCVVDVYKPVTRCLRQGQCGRVRVLCCMIVTTALLALRSWTLQSCKYEDALVIYASGVNINQTCQSVTLSISQDLANPWPHLVLPPPSLPDL